MHFFLENVVFYKWVCRFTVVVIAHKKKPEFADVGKGGKIFFIQNFFLNRHLRLLPSFVNKFACPKFIPKLFLNNFFF